MMGQSGQQFWQGQTPKVPFVDRRAREQQLHVHSVVLLSSKLNC